jgi:hypothetical protein
MTGKSSAELRAELGHPVIDCDGHVIEPAPLVAEFLRDLVPAPVVDRFLTERRVHPRDRAVQVAWWGPPTDAHDRAAIYAPKLLHERLPELGFDFSIAYPSLGLGMVSHPDDDLRPAVCRALNQYNADSVRGLGDRLTIPACIPMQNVTEALDELDYAVNVLGMRCVMLSGTVRGDGRPVLIGLDEQPDYDPVWERCLELGVAATFHAGTLGQGSRVSGLYVYNHIGAIAAAGEAIAKALLMGGVTWRFPDLNFAFLEGGVAWGAVLLMDLVAHWQKRGGRNIHALDPARVDRREFAQLLARYGGARFDEAVTAAIDGSRDFAPDEPDDFSRASIENVADLIERFVPHFYFGCEADDRANAWGFATHLNPGGARLHAVLGSDIGHWDVLDMRTVLLESRELVECGAITEDDFRDLVCDNAIRLHATTNPQFFAGTAVESYASALLEKV